MSSGRSAVPLPPRPWVRAICWLAFLAPFFYLTYGAATALAARRHDLPSIVFSWERYILFLDWTIVPYWSINLFYAFSVFICASAAELDTHGRRLVTAQLVAVACFILFPLEFSFQRPPTDGLTGLLFTVLTSFDRPFNQAPSLHIALLVILWPLYVRHLPRRWHWLLHAWFALVGASVLTTYQHHFFDIPTGILLGVFCIWMWPIEGRTPLANMSLTTDRKRLVLAARYLTGAAFLAVCAWRAGGAALWLFWPVASLTLVAANYAVLGPGGFQKGVDGRMSLAARIILAPYLEGAFLNSRWWTRREPDPVPIGGGVWLGRKPSRRETVPFRTVIDLCAELPRATAPAWTCMPMLDLVTPEPSQLRAAATLIEEERSKGPLLVCCALGYSRSAAVVATWLLTNQATGTAEDAIEHIRRVRPGIVINSSLAAAIAAAAEPRVSVSPLASAS